ncbi:hypothetical protein Daus18300_008773 [Diaporthe australafricana]|uniref:Xylanolytic transcriptional activator regulatory domain-containing protein n=1 Tax=Diaporthe australafricana TaxID=127596 RepID=A0ABR3WHA3_9PEZI
MPSRELDPPAAADVSFLPSLRTPSPSGADNSASHHVRHQQPDDEVPRDRDLGPGESQITAMGTVASEDGRDSDATPRDEFYHGNSSAASFIKETCNGVMSLQEVFNPQISDSGRSLMPGPTRPAWRTSASYVLPPRPLADHLVERYFDRVFPLYPFIHRPSFERAYKSLWEPTGMSQPIGPDDPNPPHVGLGGSPNAGANSVVFHCALNVMFALACHFSEWIDENRDETALGFLDRSKSLMTLDFLESETLGVVQALLITALFFQSTTFAGPCWNSIGIACRLAQGAGLHTESGGARWSPIETEMRRRVWHSCVVLDM